ncbi:MAG: type II toxin-antitoxin system PemK/MazF family toxin [Candidatus Limnocylindrales bacterium]
MRWSIVLVDLGQTVGHEQSGTRRVLVVSNEAFHRSGLVTVCPITASRSEARFRGDVPIPAGEGGQTLDGIVICSQVRTLSTRRILVRPLGLVVDPFIRASVRRNLRHHFGLDIPPVVDRAAA